MRPAELKDRLLKEYATLWRAAQAFDQSRSGGWLHQQIETGVPDDRLRNWLAHRLNIQL